MISNVSRKALAVGGITVMTAGMIAIGAEVTKGVLFEIQNARAAIIAAKAETEKAKAEAQKAEASRMAADAARLDAQNKLLAAIEAKTGAMVAAQYMARATEQAARVSGDALVDATRVDRYVDNQVFTDFTNPLLFAPAKKIASYNDQIVRLRHEVETGIDGKTRRFLTSSERDDRLAEERILEEELTTVQETTGKNLRDSIAMLFGGLSQGMGGLGNMYTTATSSTARRVMDQ